jgi:hypothetical protein
MTQNSYPFADQPTTEAQYSEGFSRLQLTGVDGHPGDNELKVFADSTGMQVKAPPGFAIIRGHFYENTDEVLLELSASSTAPRRDLVVLRLDASVDSVVLAVVEGVPSVSPSDPSLVQVPGGIWEEPVARVLVAASASTIGPNDVQDLRRFLGTQFGRWRTTTRPASPLPGTAGYNTTTGTPEFWTGTAWSAFTPTEISANIITSGTLDEARIPNLNASKITTGALGVDRIPSLNASKITSGRFDITRMPTSSGVTKFLMWDGAIGATTFSFITFNDVPNLPAIKITSGSFAEARIPNLPASRITSGSFEEARIPNLPASKITSGSFSTDRIPDLSANKITSDRLSAARLPTSGTANRFLKVGSANTNPAYSAIAADDVPNLAAAKITSGTFSTSRIPDLSADKITSGEFSTSRIPNISASKITSGTLSRPVVTTGNGTFNAAWNNNITSERRAVWMTNTGELGHTASSRKFKKDIKDTAMSLEDVLKLRVTDFKYKASPDHVETGMIAEEVAETGLEFLVSRNEDGSPHGVHYEMLSLAVLALAQEQQKQIEALVARVEELEANNAA